MARVTIPRSQHDNPVNKNGGASIAVNKRGWQASWDLARKLAGWVRADDAEGLASSQGNMADDVD